jgi:hypothetical protein
LPVGDDESRKLALKLLECFSSTFRKHDVMPARLQHQLEGPKIFEVIVDQKHS